VLTWWEGKILFGKGLGRGAIYDSSYRRIATVRAANGYRNDEHEFMLTPRGTALITIAVPVTYDLRSVGGPKHGAVYDTAIQEIDVETGLVEFEWHGVGRIPFTDSYERYHAHRRAPFDPFHLNSIDPQPNGDLLISARNTDAAYELNRRTGAIRWQIGGKRSSFRMGSGSRFVGQHDVRRGRNGTITVFDNGAGVSEEGFRPARGPAGTAPRTWLGGSSAAGRRPRSWSRWASRPGRDSRRPCRHRGISVTSRSGHWEATGPRSGPRRRWRSAVVDARARATRA